jgi:acetyltransferase-like isoleucine patch superfamily enzyme
MPVCIALKIRLILRDFNVKSLRGVERVFPLPRYRSLISTSNSIESDTMILPNVSLFARPQLNYHRRFATAAVGRAPSAGPSILGPLRRQESFGS